MVGNDNVNFPDPENIYPSGPSVPLTGERPFPSPEGDRESGSPASRPYGRTTEAKATMRREQASVRPGAVKSAGNGCATLTLDDVNAVDVRCAACNTVLRFPRTQWVNSPECCPNCGTRWMRRPAPDGLLTEDVSSYVFLVIDAFREALRDLAAVGQTAGFTLALEMEGSPNPAMAGSPPAGKKKNDNA